MGIKLEDLLPAGLSGDNLDSSFDLNLKQSKVFRIYAKVTASSAGTITNTATLNWNNQRLSADASLKVVLPVAPAPPAKLELTKTVDRELVQPGEIASFTITVTNTGGSSAEAVKLEDILPSGLSGQNLNSSFDLPAGESKTFTVPSTVTATSNRTITNTATVNWNGRQLNASARVKVLIPAKLEITKTVDRQNVQPGETATFTIKVNNIGGSSATGIKLEDVLPAGLSGENLNSSFDLKAGESKSFTVPTLVTASSSGTIINTARTLWNGERLSADAALNVLVPVIVPVVVVEPSPEPAKLELTKTVDRQNVQPGETVNFTITVTNTGGSSASGVNLIDLLPAGLSGDMLNEVFELPAGATKVFVLPARVSSSSSGTITNTAEVFWKTERLSAKASLNVSLPAAPAKLELTKTVDRSSVLTGDTASFTITVKNLGGSSATGIKLEDTLPAGLTGENLNTSFELSAGESRSFTILTKVTSLSSGSIINTASLNWNGTAQQASAKLEVTVPVPAPAKLEFSKTVDRNLVKAGETVNFSLNVTNSGGSLARGIKLADILPVGLTGTNLEESFDLAANQTRSFKLSALVGSDASGTITNSATLDWNGTQLTSSASLEIKPSLGTLSVNAVALTCGTSTKLSSIGYSINGKQYTTDTSLQLAPGTYSVIPQELAGSSSQALTVTVRANETTTVSLEYAVVIGLDFDNPELDLIAGETDTITVTAFTDFPYAVPASIAVVLPNSVQALNATTINGTVSSETSLELAIKLRALKSTNAEIIATLGKACVTASATLTISAKPLPDQRRESQVLLLAKVTQIPTGSRVILSDRIPSNASYVPGSSRVLRDPRFDVNTPANSAGEIIPDPYVVGDRLFWVIPEKAYQAMLRKQNLKSKVLLSAAQTRSIYGISYKLAHTDALEMPKDQIAVILASPNSRSASDLRTAMLDPNSSIGRELGNAELRVIVGDPSVLNLIALALPTSQNPVNNQSVGGAAVFLRVTCPSSNHRCQRSSRIADRSL